MTVIQFPFSRPYRPSSAAFTLVDQARVARSGETGTSQVSQRPGARWRLDLEWGNRSPRDAALLQAKIAEGLGRVNTWSMWYFPRPLPWGSINGTAVLAQTVPFGASTATIAAGANSTLEAGDWIDFGSQLAVVTGSTGVGTMTIGFSPPARRAFQAGLFVAYTYPKGIFRLQGNDGITVTHHPGFSPGLAATFLEEP